MTDADALAESLLEHGISAMKIWPFDPGRDGERRHDISTEQLKTALEPFEKIRKRVGDKMDIMVEFHSLWNLPTAKQIAKALEPYNADLVRRPDPHEFAAGAGRIRALDRDARSAPAKPWDHAGPSRTCSTATRWKSSWSISAGPAA